MVFINFIVDNITRLDSLYFYRVYALGFILGPDRNSGSGGIWAGTGSGPLPVDLAGTRPVPRFFSERVLTVFNVVKRTVENRYSIKSENVEMLLFMKYN